jgi:hypothetical protein
MSLNSLSHTHHYFVPKTSDNVIENGVTVICIRSCKKNKKKVNV